MLSFMVHSTPIFPLLIVKVNVVNYNNQDGTTEDSDPSGMTVWITPLGKC